MRTVFPDTAEEPLKAEFFGAVRSGFFVEVGANDPQRGSQSWPLEQTGWTGILVEPQPDLTAQLRQKRKARVVAAACSSPENAGAAMTLYLSGPHSSLRPELAVARSVAHGTIDVPTRTLDDILAEAGAPTPIDFVSIDVEGHEVEVLRGFNIPRWRPRLILVEDHVTNLATHRYLSGAGYRLIRRTGLNGWYVPANEAPPLGAFGAWQIARKYYLALPFRVLRERKRRLQARFDRTRSARDAACPSPSPDTDLISVIVSTYNREDALDAALRALAGQSDRNFEIIVADDGSGPQTARVVERWALRVSFAIKHVRHEHSGFRGGEIRNRGILASAGKYCVFIDGDCLARTDFIARHRALAEPGWWVSGNRILLAPEFTRAALAAGTPVETWGLTALVREWLRGGVNRLLPALRLPLGPLRKLNPHSWKGAQTCNLAVARSDLDRIDGFDGSYVGWGLEDSDLVARLLHAGVRRKDGRFATGVLHLWHAHNDRSQLSVNQAKLAATLAENRVLPSRGMSALAREAEVNSAGNRSPSPLN
ncbi:MAG: FkbM family methyltransferase [Hyphomicrobiales bacterium]|nr:FkbM family methyltransferase [Hyphomicrobiales bacterium]